MDNFTKAVKLCNQAVVAQRAGNPVRFYHKLRRAKKLVPRKVWRALVEGTARRVAL